MLALAGAAAAAAVLLCVAVYALLAVFVRTGLIKPQTAKLLNRHNPLAIAISRVRRRWRESGASTTASSTHATTGGGTSSADTAAGTTAAPVAEPAPADPAESNTDVWSLAPAVQSADGFDWDHPRIAPLGRQRSEDGAVPVPSDAASPKRRTGAGRGGGRTDFSALQYELVDHILTFSSARELARVTCVNTRLSSAAQRDHLWTALLQRLYGVGAARAPVDPNAPPAPVQAPNANPNAGRGNARNRNRPGGGAVPFNAALNAMRPVMVDAPVQWVLGLPDVRAPYGVAPNGFVAPLIEAGEAPRAAVRRVLTAAVASVKQDHALGIEQLQSRERTTCQGMFAGCLAVAFVALVTWMAAPCGVTVFWLLARAGAALLRVGLWAMTAGTLWSSVDAYLQQPPRPRRGGRRDERWKSEAKYCAIWLTATIVAEAVVYRYFGVRTAGLFTVLQYAARGLGTVALTVTACVCAFLILVASDWELDTHAPGWVMGAFGGPLGVALIDWVARYWAWDTPYAAVPVLVAHYTLLHVWALVWPVLLFIKCVFTCGERYCSAYFLMSGFAFWPALALKLMYGWPLFWLPLYAAAAHIIRAVVWCGVGYNVISVINPRVFAWGNRDDYAGYLFWWSLPTAAVEITGWWFRFEMPWLLLALRVAVKAAALLWCGFVSVVMCLITGGWALNKWHRNNRHPTHELPLFAALVPVSWTGFTLIDAFTRHMGWRTPYVDDVLGYALVPAFGALCAVWRVMGVVLLHFAAFAPPLIACVWFGLFVRGPRAQPQFRRRREWRTRCFYASCTLVTLAVWFVQFAAYYYFGLNASVRVADTIALLLRVLAALFPWVAAYHLVKALLHPDAHHMQQRMWGLTLAGVFFELVWTFGADHVLRTFGAVHIGPYIVAANAARKWFVLWCAGHLLRVSACFAGPVLACVHVIWPKFVRYLTARGFGRAVAPAAAPGAVAPAADSFPAVRYGVLAALVLVSRVLTMHVVFGAAWLHGVFPTPWLDAYVWRWALWPLLVCARFAAPLHALACVCWVLATAHDQFRAERKRRVRDAFVRLVATELLFLAVRMYAGAMVPGTNAAAEAAAAASAGSSDGDLLRTALTALDAPKLFTTLRDTLVPAAFCGRVTDWLIG